jgi:hypothetical protein
MGMVSRHLFLHHSANYLASRAIIGHKKQKMDTFTC